MAVFTDSGGFIIPSSALQVDPAVKKLSTKRQNGHFLLPLARRVETSVNPMMVAPMEGAAEGQDVDEKMDEELPVEERSARVVRKSGEPTPEERSAHEATHLPFRDWCHHCVSCRATDPAHWLTERAEGEPPMVQIDCQFASEKVNMEISEEQVVTAGPTVTILMATFCGMGVVAATQCSTGATAYLAALLKGQLAAWGLGSGTLVLRADRETSLTTLLHETKARKAETLVERTAVDSHQSIGAVERMNREVAGLLRTLKTALEARFGAKVGLEHDLISWMIRHSAWLITRFRVRASGHTAYELIRQRRYGGATVEFGEIVWARIPTAKKLRKLDQCWVEVVWAGKAEGSDEHIALDHRGARRFRAVRREPESSRWRREVIVEVAGCPWDMRPVGRTFPPDAFRRVAVFWRPCTGGTSRWDGSRRSRATNCRSTQTTTGRTSRAHQLQAADAVCTLLMQW